MLNKNAAFSSPSSPDNHHATCCLYESDSTKVAWIDRITLCWSFCVCLFHLAKVCIVKAMVFPVVMWRGEMLQFLWCISSSCSRCERWTIKKAEHQRIDAFELWCWRRPLSVSWTARRSNQSILKEISLGYSLEGLIVKLMANSWLTGKDPDAGKDWRQRKGRQRTRWLDGITDSKDMSLRKLREMAKDQQDWHAAVHGVTKSQTWLSDSTAIISSRFRCCSLCQNSLPFHGWIIFHCVDRPHFIYPFICWWTFGLFAPFGYCEWCYYM